MIAGAALGRQKMRQVDQRDHHVVMGDETGQEVRLLAMTGARHILDLGSGALAVLPASSLFDSLQ
jgi:hypothetical protein